MAGAGYLFSINPAFSVHDLHRNYTEGAPSPFQARDRWGEFHFDGHRAPATWPTITSSVAVTVFAVCSCTVATLSLGRGDGFTRTGGFRITSLR